jgi:uncharacterized protein YeaO (DUF488 family)
MAPKALDVRVKRVYEPSGSDDGARVLVDRLWPRGLSNVEARLDRWLRGAAPSTALRRWYEHDPAKWSEFLRRYRAELDAAPEALAELRALAAAGPVTLLFASRELVLNNAVALRAFLRESGPASPRSAATKKAPAPAARTASRSRVKAR